MGWLSNKFAGWARTLFPPRAANELIDMQELPAHLYICAHDVREPTLVEVALRAIEHGMRPATARMLYVVDLTEDDIDRAVARSEVKQTAAD
jgi:hypothetical protein